MSVKRIAYVGLSTPLFYDYGYQKKARADKGSSPNPILDSPTGLILLYDEIWFLTRSLCPVNMRKLPFVTFLDESGLLPDIDDIVRDMKNEELVSPLILSNYGEFCANTNDQYWSLITFLRIDWDARHDNHTHALSISGHYLSGNSFRLDNFIFDLLLVSKLGNPNVELITNSFSSQWLDSTQEKILPHKLAEYMIIEDIPNLLTRKGPYHTILGEMRENEFLKDYRNWVMQESERASKTEINEIKEQAEKQIMFTVDEMLSEAFDNKQRFYSVAKTIATDSIGLILPFFATAVSIPVEYNKYLEAEERRWQAFIVSERLKCRR